MKVRCIIALCILGTAGIALLIISMLNISVIGGADGPTSVFVSSRSGKDLLYVVTAIIIILTIILFIVYKRKKRL